jgi:hypothetical protein
MHGLIALLHLITLKGFYETVDEQCSGKMTIFWVTTFHRSLLIALMMETVNTFESSVNFYETQHPTRQSSSCSPRRGPEVSGSATSFAMNRFKRPDIYCQTEIIISQMISSFKNGLGRHR